MTKQEITRMRKRGRGRKGDSHDVLVVLLVGLLGFVHPEGGDDDGGDADVEAGDGTRGRGRCGERGRKRRKANFATEEGIMEAVVDNGIGSSQTYI